MPAAPTAPRPPPDVAKYLDALPPTHRATLLKLRASVLSALPGATERISYKIPAFEKDGRVVVWMAAFKDHLSFFGAHAGSEAARKLAGKGYEVKGSTIVFAPDKPLPAKLVRAVVKARLAVVAPTKRTRPRKATKKRASRTRKA